MAGLSTIEWTDASWNPVTGCTKVSPGCTHCYAERMAKRLQAMGQPLYSKGFAPSIHEELLDAPLKWKKPKTIFVNSMSDLFHESIPDSFIHRIFDVMKRAEWHIFQILTKRDGRLAELSGKLEWTRNIWMGVSVENNRYINRIDSLRTTPAIVKFLSLEPLLGPLPDLDLYGIDWVVVGGESGPKARPMKEEWVLEIKSNCIESDVAFFFKQWGGFNKKKNGRLLEGKTWDEMPVLDRR